MIEQTKTARTGIRAAVYQINSHPNYNAVRRAPSVQDAKQYAVLAYCYGWRTLEETSAAFAANPAWRSA